MSQLDIKQIKGDSTGSILFLGTNSVVEDFDKLNWVNDKLSIIGDVGINTITPTAQLHIAATSALSTHTVFQIRNSADSGNILEVNGSGSVWSTGGGFIVSNTAYGLNALLNNTTGVTNTANGFNALLNNTTGELNTAIGVNALLNNTSGSFNTASGRDALLNNTSGSNNTASGLNALRSNTSGGNNVAYGRNAGRRIADGVTENTITNNSIFIGNEIRALADNQTNQIVIGHTAIGNGSNTVTLGNNSITNTYLKGILNIDTLGASTSVNNLGIDANGNIVVGSQPKFNFAYNQNSLDFYDDGNIRLSWLSSQRIRLAMLTEPGGSGDLRSNFRTDGGTTQGVFIVSTGTNYNLNTVTVGPGMVAEWSVGAENDGTYPIYEIRAFTTNPDVIITINKIN